MISRRLVLGGLGGLVMAPAIVRASSIMRIKTRCALPGWAGQPGTGLVLAPCRISIQAWYGELSSPASGHAAPDLPPHLSLHLPGSWRAAWL